MHALAVGVHLLDETLEILREFRALGEGRDGAQGDFLGGRRGRQAADRTAARPAMKMRTHDFPLRGDQRDCRRYIAFEYNRELACGSPEVNCASRHRMPDARRTARWRNDRSRPKSKSSSSAPARNSAAKAFSRSPRRCCSPACPTSPATRARRSRIWSTCWPTPTTSCRSSASASRRAPTRPPPPPRSPPRSTIRCAAPRPSSRRSAPTWPPTRSPISPPAASPAGR